MTRSLAASQHERAMAARLRDADAFGFRRPRAPLRDLPDAAEAGGVEAPGHGKRDQIAQVQTQQRVSPIGRSDDEIARPKTRANYGGHRAPILVRGRAQRRQQGIASLNQGQRNDPCGTGHGQPMAPEGFCVEETAQSHWPAA